MMSIPPEMHDVNYYLWKGDFERALELDPENERALAGYARALYSNEEYEKSLEVYEKLLKIQPEKKSYLLYKAVCQIELHQYEEAEKMLFKLNYE